MAGIAETWIGRRVSVARTAFVRFGSSNSGATAIEYAMVAVLFAVTAIGIWNTTGSSIGRMYDRIGTAVLGAQ